jgi:predicted PurR-regulated permease PerM
MNKMLNPPLKLAPSESQGSSENSDADSVAIQETALLNRADAVIDSPSATGGFALSILAAIAVVFTLSWAQDIVISLLLGVIFAYTLNPVVVWLERIKIPRVVGAGVVVVAVVCGLVFGAYSLRGQAQAILTQLPEAVSKLSAELVTMKKGQIENMKNIQAAASDMVNATNPTGDNSTSHKKPARNVVVDAPTFKLGNFLWVGSMGILGFIGQASMVVFLVFFLLLAADTFKRKLVRVTGPSLSRRKITVHILDDINHSIQRYMLILLLTNVLVALLSWLAFRWIGLENAGAWAVAAGLLHMIPYVGPGITAGAAGMAAFMQFDSLSMVLLVSGASLLIATVVGTFLTTWMIGRIGKINAAAVFISLLFWAWLWGGWGMLLSMPIIVIVKVVSQHVERMQLVGELIGE